jgi:hypothetical protein
MESTRLDRSSIQYPFVFGSVDEAALQAAERNIFLRRQGADYTRYVVYQSYQLFAPEVLYAVGTDSEATEQRLERCGFLKV